MDAARDLETLQRIPAQLHIALIIVAETVSIRPEVPHCRNLRIDRAAATGYDYVADIQRLSVHKPFCKVRNDLLVFGTVTQSNLHRSGSWFRS